MDFLRLILASVAEYLHDACSILSNFLEELESAFDVFWAAICEDDSKSHGVFNGLCTALALVCKQKCEKLYSQLVQKYARGSIG